MFYCYMESPVGTLFLAGDREGLKHINFPEEKKPVAPGPGWLESPAFFTSTVAELKEYFAAQTKAIFDRHQAAGNFFSARVSGGRFEKCLSEKPSAMVNWRGKLETLKLRGRSGRPTAPIRFRLSSPATGSSAPAEI